MADNDTQQDGDADGVSDTVEQGAANHGDGNADGIPDSQQTNVASLPNAVDASYVTFAVPAGMQLVSVHAIANPSPADMPPNSSFPIGFFQYTIANVGSGQAAIVTVHGAAEVTINSYLKYGVCWGKAGVGGGERRRGRRPHRLANRDMGRPAKHSRRARGRGSRDRVPPAVGSRASRSVLCRRGTSSEAAAVADESPLERSRRDHRPGLA